MNIFQDWTLLASTYPIFFDFFSKASTVFRFLEKETTPQAYCRSAIFRSFNFLETWLTGAKMSLKQSCGSQFVPAPHNQVSRPINNVWLHNLSRLVPSRFYAAEERRRRGFGEGDEGRAKGYGKDGLLPSVFPTILCAPPKSDWVRVCNLSPRVSFVFRHIFSSSTFLELCAVMWITSYKAPQNCSAYILKVASPVSCIASGVGELRLA